MSRTPVPSGLRDRRLRSRLVAVLAGAGVVALGATATLASWTDTEWVLGRVSGGGAGGTDAPVGTSVFEVQQSPDGVTWSDRETRTTPGVVDFSPGALAISPGDAVYARVLLSTRADSVAGDVLLSAAESQGTPGALWPAMRLRVVTASGSGAACNAASFTSAQSATWSYLVGQSAPVALATGATVEQRLAEKRGSVQAYCFELSLPGTTANRSDQSLMGQTIDPMWRFDGESD
jgi:predicted ribosomally synthesized peptide with SipW-like signal peptide